MLWGLRLKQDYPHSSLSPLSPLFSFERHHSLLKRRECVWLLLLAWPHPDCALPILSPCHNKHLPLLQLPVVYLPICAIMFSLYIPCTFREACKSLSVPVIKTCNLEWPKEESQFGLIVPEGKSMMMEVAWQQAVRAGGRGVTSSPTQGKERE